MADNKITTTAAMGGINVASFTSRVAALKSKLSPSGVLITAADVVEMCSIFNMWLSHTHTYQDTVITGTTEARTTSAVSGASIIQTNDIVASAIILASHYNRIINGSNSAIKSHTHTLLDNNGLSIGSEESNATSPPSAATITNVQIGEIISATKLVTILTYLSGLTTHTHTYTDNYLDVIKETVSSTAAPPVFLNMNLANYFTNNFAFGDIVSAFYYTIAWYWNGDVDKFTYSNNKRTISAPTNGGTGLICLDCNLSFYTSRALYLEFTLPAFSTSNTSGSGIGIAAVPYTKNVSPTNEAFNDPRSLLMYNTAAFTITPTSPTTCIINRQGVLTNVTLPEVSLTVGMFVSGGNVWMCFVTGNNQRQWITGVPLSGTPTFTGIYTMKYPNYTGTAWGFTPMPCVYNSTLTGTISVRTPSQNLAYDSMPAIAKPPIPEGMPIGIDVTFPSNTIHGATSFRQPALTLNHTGSVKVTHAGKIVGRGGKGGWAGELGNGDMIGQPGGNALQILSASTVTFAASTIVGGGGGGGDAGLDNTGGVYSPVGGGGAGMWGWRNNSIAGLLYGSPGLSDVYHGSVPNPLYDPSEPGSPPYLTEYIDNTGGTGGDLGKPGASLNTTTNDGGGGAAGYAITGNYMASISLNGATIKGVVT